MKVPKVKTLRGISAIGEAQLTIVLGNKGEILTNKK